MPRFPSREWMEELCRQVGAHEEASSLAEALEGTYAFVVEPDGPVRQRSRFDLQVRPASADAVDVRVLDEPVDDPRVTFTAKFGRWWQLINGELDPGMAIMLRRLKVSGDLWKVKSDLGSARPLLDALRGVPSEWPE